MHPSRIALAVAAAVVFLGSGVAAQQAASPRTFSCEHMLTLPGSPVEIYDAMTGDISGWWDHTFSKKPLRFALDAKPGGGFWEIFDESGDGVLHGTLIWTERGKRLRFDGPLGLAGNAVQLVTTYDFEAAGKDSTKVRISVHGCGELEEGTPGIVRQVWHHFLFERFKPYIEGGNHRLP